MKRIVAFYILSVFSLFMLPVLIISCQRTKIPEKIESSGYMVTVYDCNLDSLVKLDLEEYVIGVVAAEMPADFHPEALKAQALAARTYTLVRMKEFGGKGCSIHEGADICTDSTHCQAYKDPKKLGKGYKKFADAVLSTKGEVIIYEKQLIDAVFHSTSGGKTENSEDVWSNKIPYLRSVISEYEENSPKLINKESIKLDDFIAGIESLDRDVIINKKNISNDIEILERSEGGKITKIKIGNKIFTGKEIREKFGLNSANFTYNVKGKEICFNTIGYGHGIGMSQYGANGMARNGYDYRSIIRHYYLGVEVASIESFL